MLVTTDAYPQPGSSVTPVPMPVPIPPRLLTTQPTSAAAARFPAVSSAAAVNDARKSAAPTASPIRVFMVCVVCMVGVSLAEGPKTVGRPTLGEVRQRRRPRHRPAAPDRALRSTYSLRSFGRPGHGTVRCARSFRAWSAVMRALSSPTAVPDSGAVDVDVWYPEAVEKETVTLPRAARDHLDALYRVARNLTGRDDDAEDLVQETYTRALAAWAQFTEGTNLRAWLFRILRNAHIDAYRRARANPVHGGLEDEFAADTGSSREPLRGDAELER